jgi:hypothetical protein
MRGPCLSLDEFVLQWTDSARLGQNTEANENNALSKGRTKAGTGQSDDVPLRSVEVDQGLQLAAPVASDPAAELPQTAGKPIRKRQNQSLVRDAA